MYENPRICMYENPMMNDIIMYKIIKQMSFYICLLLLNKCYLQLQIKSTYVKSMDIIIHHFRKTPYTSMYFHVYKKNYPASSGHCIFMI